MSPLGPEFLDSDEARAALVALDIGALYRLLKRLGVSQRQIAGLTDQSQSEVCEILNGRKVLNVHVLRRIADGLGMPRERMGLSYGETEPDPAPVAQEVSEVVKRRVVLAAMMNEPFLSVRGAPITLPLPTPTHDPLPSRLFPAHVHAVRTVTEHLRALARYRGGQADHARPPRSIWTWANSTPPNGSPPVRYVPTARTTAETASWLSCSWPRYMSAPGNPKDSSWPATPSSG